MLDGKEIGRTPLLIPSFSSKGFPRVDEILRLTSEVITDAVLVSAYDLSYKKISPPFEFPEFIFLDSGGYEASKEREISDVSSREHVPQVWTREMHDQELEQWRSTVPSVFISFDSPEERLPVDEQIARARGMAPGRHDVLREILFKPESANEQYLELENITRRVHALADFQVIGVTEKELGNSLHVRMRNIAKLRIALTTAGLQMPIHVFGSLDTVSTPLYFLAGADIFDGLTWLRYAFYKGMTIYRENYGAFAGNTKATVEMINLRCWHDNYLYMKNLEGEMRRFLIDHDYSLFSHNNELFSKAIAAVMESLGD